MPLSERPMCIVHPLKTENCPQLQPKGRANENNFGISFEGLPTGSTPAQVARCIQLLEHIFSCGREPGKCPEGEECHRTRQVLAHHFSCRNKRRHGGGECNICQQLLALCRNHSERCQANEGNCAVPYCKNKKVKSVPNPNKTRPDPPAEECTRKEYQHVIRKLSETMELPTKQQKLREIERLMETNRQATAHVLRCILGKKQKSLNNLSISKGIKPMTGPRVVLHPKMWRPALTSSLIKLEVVIRG